MIRKKKMGNDKVQTDLFINDQIDALELQIKEKQKITDHEIREFPVSVIVEKFTIGLDKDEAELYVPDYQREFIWTDEQQSRFIESQLETSRCLKRECVSFLQ
jgi:uncharacterized protein with ParB-like and HNH nuclease domain